MEFPRSASRDAQTALDLLVKQCADEADCHSRYGDAAAMIARLDRRLASGPLTGRVTHPRTGKPIVISFPRDAVFDTIRGALYLPQDAAGVLHLVDRALDGDLAPLAAQSVRTASVSTDSMAIGSTMAILCSEDLPQSLPADVIADASGSVFGTSYADAWRDRCARWPKGPGLEFDRQSTVPVPALILSGTHDPVTPPRWGETMARHFPRHQLVVVPGASHNTSFTGCVPDLIVAFVTGGGGAVDAACVSRATWPKTVLGPEGPR
jgi:pimeloyl-ACP methyl ester carboxylesterase